MGFHGNAMAVLCQFMALPWGVMAPTSLVCDEKRPGVTVNMPHADAMGGPMQPLPWDCHCRKMAHRWLGGGMMVNAIAMHGS